MKKRIISLMLILCMMLSCGAISAFAQAKSSDTVTFFFHCSSDFTTDGTVRCVLTPKDNILESEIIYGIKSINNFYKFTIPEFSSYYWFTIDNGVDAQYEADPDVNVTDAFVIAGSGAVYSHDGDQIVDINDKIYTNYAIHWADFRYYYGLGDWMDYDPWLRFHRHLIYTSNRNFECRTTDFYYWFKYKELYTFNNNILTFGTDGKITEEASYGVYGDYVMRNHESYSPSVSGYNVYLSKVSSVVSLREAYDTNVEGIEKVFTEYGLGELIGDMDNDRTINVLDATIIQRNLAKITDFAENDEITGSCEKGSVSVSYISDYNRDNNRNILDATAIQIALVET